MVLRPQKIFYYTQNLANEFLEGTLSSFGSDSKFNQLINGGFVLFSSNVASVGDSSVFDRGEIYKLSQTPEQVTRNVKYTTLVGEQTVEVERNQEVFFGQQPFTSDDSQDSDVDDLIDSRLIKIEIPQNSIDNQHRFFTIGSYDIFDGSVINEYEGLNPLDGIKYKRKAIPLSNVVELGTGGK